MNRIRKINFINHPVLGNLDLNFCDNRGKSVDTVIIAGENGCGKSTLIKELYDIATYNVKNELCIEVEHDGKIYEIAYKREVDGAKSMYATDENTRAPIYSEYFKKTYCFSGIFSDTEINFSFKNDRSISKQELDSKLNGIKSTEMLPMEIRNLLIDIQALDDADIAYEVKTHPQMKFEDLNIEQRMERFTNAFNKMFENLTYSHVKRQNNSNEILFDKFDREVKLDDLSSGEKQIIYRGCFLLKNINSMKGAFVFIDEPEISLHPRWQKKIMDFYTGIFKDSNGNQTSQMFIVTHSPFIIHNDNRINDKIIVLSRNDEGKIITCDKLEYYRCDSVEAIEDAFYIDEFISDEKVVYLEGKTDEMYFNRALGVFNFDTSVKFKEIGSTNAEGNKINSGKDALAKSVNILHNINSKKKIACIFDCDVNKQINKTDYLLEYVMPFYDNCKNIRVGIENALVLDNIEIESFYKERQKTDEYGAVSSIKNLNKMEMCEYICGLSDDQLKIVFSNLKPVIQEVVAFYNEI